MICGCVLTVVRIIVTTCPFPCGRCISTARCDPCFSYFSACRDILSLSTTGYGCKLFQLAITQLIDLFCKQLAFLFRAAATRNHPLPIRIKCNIGVTLSFRQFCRCHPVHIRYHNLIAVRIKHWRSVFFEQMCTNVNIRIPRNMNVRMLPAINGYPI